MTTDETADLAAALDLAGEPALVLRRAAPGRPAPVLAHVNPAFAAQAGLVPEEALAALLRAAERGEALAERQVDLGDLSGEAAPAGFVLRGRPLTRRPDLYLAWLARRGPDGAPWGGSPLPRPGEPGETARRLAGLTRECLYELTVEVDCRLRLAWADPRLAELTGQDPGELLAAGGFFPLVVEADRAELHRRNQRLLAGQQAAAQYRLRRKDGTLRRVRDVARPERAQDGQAVVRIVGTLADLAGEAPPAVASALLERQARLVAAALDAFVCLIDRQERVRGAWGRSIGGGEGLTERLRQGVGQGLAGLLPAADLEVWLDWLGEASAADSGEAEPTRFSVGPAAGQVGGDEPGLEVTLTALDDELVQVIVRERGRPAPSLDGSDAERGATGPDAGAVLDALPEPVLLVGPHGRVLAANPAFERLLGLPPGDLAGAAAVERLATPAARELLAQTLLGVSTGGGPSNLPGLACQAGAAGEQALDLRLTPVRPGGGGTLADAALHEGDTASAAWVLIEAGRAGGTAAPSVGADGTAAAQGEPWFNTILDGVADGIVTLDADGAITWLSRSAETIFDYPRAAAVGAPISLLLARGAPDAEEGGPLAGLLGVVGAGGGDGRRAGPRELVARRRSGELIPIEAEATAVDHAGRRVVILTVRDITVRRQTEEALRSLAYHDPLTGLPNRLLFHDRLSRAIEQARRNRQLLAVMLVDLDRFKLINDSLGLEKGDQVLKAAADRLSGALRRSDTVARLGGDEFMVLLLGTQGAEAAAKVAQKLLESLKPALRVNGHELTTAASVGIALFPHDGDDADTLVKNADTALSRAKEQGRNRYQFYTVDMNATAFERLMLETRLRKALAQDEFVLHYQPKVSLADGSVVGVEALLRWFDPDLGLVSPAEFVPLAEETGLIVPIGKWVLRTACAEARRWHRLGFEHLGVAVNLSARQFQERDLVEVVSGVVGETGLPPAALELEITESVLMRDPAGTADRLRQLTDLGIRLAVDDFGTGYSSLGYLKTFPIRTLKIDRSFVRDIDKDPSSAAIAQAIVALAAGLGMRVVAEGVETRSQLDVLRRLGCQEVQGYLFARPMPPDDVLALLREGRRLEG